MKESKFIEQNKEKWIGFERLLKSESKDPDKLSNFFIQITDDLSYARTFYNNRTIRLYLNNICQQLFYIVYKTPKKGNLSGFSNFWKKDLPVIAYQSRKQLLTAFVIFAISIGIGVLSAANDPEFVRIILGNDYVNMTIENIESGDPMAVYKKMNEVDMFLGITLNNLLVSVKTFLMGILWAAGSVIILLYNGIMVGAFQYFFIEQGLFAESFLTIWLHGTLEMSAIVIAGAAGLVLGNGIIAPGSYSRLQSFKIAAKRGAQLFLGIIPILIVAALIESFLTRYTEVPDELRLILIVLSLVFMLFYFVWYPHYIVKTKKVIIDEEKRLQASPDFTIKYEGVIKTGGDILRDTFLFYRKRGKTILRINLIATLIYISVVFFIIFPKLNISGYVYGDWLFQLLAEFFNYEKNPLLLPVNAIFFAGHSLAIMLLILKEIIGKIKVNNKVYIAYFIWAGLLNILIYFLYFISLGLEIIVSFFVAPIIILSLFIILKDGEIEIFKAIGRAREMLKENYGYIYGLTFMVFLITAIGYFFMNSPFPIFYMDFINWNIPLEPENRDFVLLILNAFSSMFTILITTPLFFISITLSYFSFIEIREANDLKKKVALFGRK